MKDKFAEYFNTNERIEELSDYVHENFKIIMTKMISEMRRKLDIEAEMTNKDGYLSLMASLQGRLFNEMVYSLAGIIQSCRLDPTSVIPISTLDILISTLSGKNPLKGEIRTDVKNDPEKFKKLYFECIDELRSVKEGLPKEKE